MSLLSGNLKVRYFCYFLTALGILALFASGLLSTWDRYVSSPAHLKSVDPPQVIIPPVQTSTTTIVVVKDCNGTNSSVSTISTPILLQSNGSSNCSINPTAGPYVGKLFQIHSDWATSEKHRCRSFFTCPMCRERPKCLNNQNSSETKRLRLVACTLAHPFYLQWIPEWIEYHLAQGFEKFVIFDDSKPGEEENLMCHHCLHPYIAAGILDLVSTKDLDYEVKSCNKSPKFVCRQLRAFESCARTWRGRADWMGMFDLDEFIYVNLPNRTIYDLVTAETESDASKVNTFYIEGVGFGLNGWISNMPPGVLLIESHTKRMPIGFLGEEALYKKLKESTAICKVGQYSCTVSYGKCLYRLDAFDAASKGDWITNVHGSYPPGKVMNGDWAAKNYNQTRYPFYTAHYRMYSVEHAKWHHDYDRIKAALNGSAFWEAIEDTSLRDNFGEKIHQQLYCRHQPWL